MLRALLLNTKCTHRHQVLAAPTLKDAHVYCKAHQLSGQLTGGLIEAYIQGLLLGCTRLSPSAERGDLQLNDAHYEVKTSNGGYQHNRFNYVQLRPAHECHYLLTAFHLCAGNVDDDGELFVFHVPQHTMKEFIATHGHYAHGTKKHHGPIEPNDLKPTAEYALRPKYGDSCWNQLLQHRIGNDLAELLLP
jgi:hypothetical protein